MEGTTDRIDSHPRPEGSSISKKRSSEDLSQAGLLNCIDEKSHISVALVPLISATAGSTMAQAPVHGTTNQNLKPSERTIVGSVHPALKM
jgi:hypothetical protein